MRYSFIRNIVYISFLLAVSHTADAVILVPQYQTLNIGHFENEVIELSHGASINILPGGSVELGNNRPSTGYINVLGGEIRNILKTPQLFDNYIFNMSSGRIAGANGLGGANCAALITGGTVDMGFHNSCNTYISGGVFHGAVGPEGSGRTNISGGIFHDILSNFDGGYLNISGGRFKSGMIQYAPGYGLDFFGYGLRFSDPFNITYSSYELRVSGYLLDGNFLNAHIVVGDESGLDPYTHEFIRVHNVGGVNPYKTVPEPSTLVLLGAGIIGIGTTRLRKTK
jgi:hypothetical protein